jgi:hypothetical protein
MSYCRAFLACGLFATIPLWLRPIIPLCLYLSFFFAQSASAAGAGPRAQRGGRILKGALVHIDQKFAKFRIFECN